MTTAQTWCVGDQGRFYTVQPFKNLAGTAADPSTVTLYIEAPDGTVTPYVNGSSAMVRDSTGTYHMDVSFTQSGIWKWRWVGIGAIIAADQGYIQVDPSITQ